MAQKKKKHKIKSSVLSRSLSLAKLTFSTGTQLASHGLGNILSKQEEKALRWKEFLTERASALSQELGELKGSLMKAGQMLSMYGEHFLPPEANEFLKSLQSQSPALAWPAIEKVLRAQLGDAKLAQLAIEPEPIGSASLGQVHRAVVKATGEVLALKVQYPGVEKAIDSDLRALKSFLSVLKVLPKGLAMDHIFAEVREMLVQEMDYAQEARATSAYRKRLEGDARYVVPKVYSEWSTKKVLATSFEAGVSPDDPLVKTLSQERRNRLALNFLDLYFTELFEWGVVQTDPHLGNYRVRVSPTGDDQLVLLDFGAVRTYDDAFLKPYHRMIKAAFEHDNKALEEAALHLKFIEHKDDPELKKLFEEFCLGTIEPFHDEYDWKRSDLPKRLSGIVLRILRKFPLRSPPREILFLDRKTGGVFVFMSVLGAKVTARDLLKKQLSNLSA